MNPQPHSEESSFLSQPVHVCVTCGNEFAGKFCNRCGEKIVSQHDRTIMHFLGEVFHMITHADGKLFRNLRLILVNPGMLSKNFSIGKRQPFMKPVAMFFVGNLIYFILPFFQTFTTTLYNQVHSHPYGPMIENTIEKKLEEKHLTYPELEKIYNQKTVGYSKLIMIILVPMFASVYALLNLRKGKLFADHLLMGLEYTCYTIFYNTIFLSVFLAIVYGIFSLLGIDINPFFQSEWNFIMPLIFLSIVYFIYRSQRTFYNDKIFPAVVKAGIFLFMMIPVLYLYRFILFHVTIFKI